MNHQVSRTRALYFMAGASLLTVASVASAQADSTASSAQDGGSLEEIVVTAQKREQNLQDVPIAITALTAERVERLGVEVARTMEEGLRGADIVMMLRLQRERMNGSFVPSSGEYFRFFGLDQKKLAYAKPDALVMHPGPMNRGVEIDSAVADDIQRSAITEQVEMGVAVRMACLDVLTRSRRGEN